MLIESCLLTVAKKEIEQVTALDFSPTISSLFLELTVAVNLTEAYYKIHNSIYWKTANNATKNRVKATCQDLINKIMDHTQKAKVLFNSYCEEQEKLGTSNPEIFKHLKLFKNKFLDFETTLNEQHQSEINPSQLSLF